MDALNAGKRRQDFLVNALEVAGLGYLYAR